METKTYEVIDTYNGNLVLDAGLTCEGAQEVLHDLDRKYPNKYGRFLIRRQS